MEPDGTACTLLLEPPVTDETGTLPGDVLWPDMPTCYPPADE